MNRTWRKLFTTRASECWG